MKLVDTATSLLSNVTSSGSRRIDAVKGRRRQSKLFTELGELTYQHQTGTPVDDAIVQGIISDLDALVHDADETPAEPVSAE